MTPIEPIELLAHTWIWYALFGVVAVLVFLRTRRRRTASIAAMRSGWAGPAARADAHGGPRGTEGRLSARSTSEGAHEGRHGHRCC